MKKILMSASKHVLVAICVVIALFFNARSVLAAEKYTVEAEIYESEPTTVFDTSSDSKVAKFSYGEKSLGTLSIQGGVIQETVYNGIKAFGVKDEITVSYYYGGGYKEQSDWKWCLQSMPITDVNDKVGNQVVNGMLGYGVVLFQKSTDGIDWQNVSDPARNAFNEKKSIGFVINDADVKNGAYYRLISAYRMKYKGNDDIYKNCVEIYKFYVCNDNNYVLVKDMISREMVKTPTEVERGFYIDKQGSDAEVTVKVPGGKTIKAKDNQSFSVPGDYTIKVKTKLNYEHSCKVHVKTGMETISLEPTICQSNKDSGFTSAYVVSNSETGDSYTSLSIGQDYGETVVTSKKGAIPTYGIYGKNVNVFLKLKYPLGSLANGYEVVYDKWGRNKKEFVAGSHYGQVGTGVLIVQTSKNGRNWVNGNDKPYSNGLSTTDYGNNYPAGGDVCIYTPSGEDILNGIYIKVMYAYQVYSTTEKKYTDYLEVYKFYLCSDELDAVTFHNLSLTKETEEQFGDWKESQVEITQKAETLTSGSMTCTGFEVDIRPNPTVQYSIAKDGEDVQKNKDNKYKDTGKYTISLTSVAGTTKDVTIYVDNSTAEESLTRYFGNFITGKRIYTEEQYPKFEGGLTDYNIKGVSDSYLPIAGEIRNKTTGTVKTIGATRKALVGTLTEPGEYEAVFTTVSQNKENEEVGDKRVYTFRFSLIKKGTAPGPQVNQKSLEKYARNNITDAYPVYYGLTYSSASKGDITLAFATREAAREYAYNYEKGKVEKQKDGSYRYNGQFKLSQKITYDSNWDLTEAENNIADQLVGKYYFDLSDEFTYRTLKDEDLGPGKNYRQLELEKSVIIFADGQKNLLTDTESLPIISPKHVVYLIPGTGGREERIEDDFEFIKDKYGCDSEEIIITDIEGKEYKIRYDEGVGKQLEEMGCASGKVTITERTHYGDSASYEAIFISRNDNKTQLTLRIHENGEEKEVIVTQHDISVPKEVDEFTLESITDETDPYALVIIKSNNEELFYVANDYRIKKAWSKPGVYSIKVVNRIGCAFEFDVKVRESDFVTISFTGEGTENLDDVITQYGSKNIELPKISRVGYELIGFKDLEGNDYGTVIDEVKSNHTIVLAPEWKLKECIITFKDNEGKVIGEDSADFGTEYHLSVPDVAAGFEFIGWSRNGDVIDNDIITVDAEEIIFVAETESIEQSVETKEQQSETVSSDAATTAAEMGNEEEPVRQTGGKGWIWLAIAGIVVAIVGYVKKDFIACAINQITDNPQKANVKEENEDLKKGSEEPKDKGDGHSEEN